MKVILVDDDVNDLESFCKAVAEIDAQIECIPLGSGRELIAHLANSEQLPDVIFLDLVMPIMDGIQCIKEMRSNRRYKDIKVVAYTSMLRIDQVATFNKLKTEILLKPYTHDQLVEEIESILSTAG